jgi:hypothetical protein
MRLILQWSLHFLASGFFFWGNHCNISENPGPLSTAYKLFSTFVSGLRPTNPNSMNGQLPWQNNGHNTIQPKYQILNKWKINK